MNVFTAGAAMKTARAAGTATLLLNGKVLIAGGYSANSRHAPFDTSTTEIYDPATDSFATSTPSMNTPRELATATLLPNGKVLIAGGYHLQIQAQLCAAWSCTTPLPIALPPSVPLR